MLEHILTTIYVGSLFIYSYFINAIVYRDEIQHYTYFITKLTETNMLFVKFMQWFASNDMSNEVKTLIRSFADNVPYNNDDIEYEQITELIQIAKKQNKILTINTVPINAGTIAIVYEGILDGEPVILKQMRKNVKEQLRSSVELMKFMAEVSVYIPYLKLFKMNEVIKYNEETLMKQIDFKIEIENGKAFGKAFEDNNDVIIPKIYDNITEYYPNFILMEKIIGIKAQEVSDEDVENYCTSYNNVLIQSLIKRGIVHADLHIGNIFFMESYKVGLIDFGNVLFIEDVLMKKISLFYKFLFNRQIKKLCKFFIDHTLIYNNPHNDSKLSEEKREILTQKILKAFEKGNVLSGTRPISIYVMLDINDILTAIDARLDEDFMNVILAIGPMSSVVSILKRNDTNNSLKRVFLGHVKDSVPDSLKNYK
jgi:predicted unusual protein kinase regulating ubiquinone biosynthesis (AarF/ABC1/UbiB family)